MRRRRRRGSARMIAAGLGGLGLLGLLVTMAIMASMSAEQAETSVKVKHHAEEQVEHIQEQLDLRGRQAERMMEQMDGDASEADEPTTAPAKDDDGE